MVYKLDRTIGIIGLGNAGSALAKAFSKKCSVIGYDINPERYNSESLSTIKLVNSIDELLLNAQIVLLSLPNERDSVEVVNDLLLSRKSPELIIETSTIGPHTAKEIGGKCKNEGVSFVDAAIGSGVKAMSLGKAVFLVGGNVQDFFFAQSILEHVAEAIHHIGETGSGSGLKIINNAVVHSILVVLIEAITMARKLQIPIPTLVDLLKGDDGITRPLLHRIEERILEGDYTGGMSVTNARKDSMLVLETAYEYGVPLFAISGSHIPYDIAKDQGLGEKDYASLATLWESWANVDLSN